MAATEVTASNFLREIRLGGASPCGQEEGGGAYIACEAYGSGHTPPCCRRFPASRMDGWISLAGTAAPVQQGGCGGGIPGLRGRADISKVRFLMRIGRLR